MCFTSKSIIFCIEWSWDFPWAPIDSSIYWTGLSVDLEQDHREILMTLHGNYVNDSCKRDRTISFYLWYQCMRWNIECRWGFTVTLGWNSHSDWLIRILEWNSPSEWLIGILGWNSHSHWSEFWICIHREIKLDVLSVDLKHNFIMMAYCSISLNSI